MRTRVNRNAQVAVLGLLFVSMALLASLMAGAAQAAPPTGDVLILNSYHSGFSWTDDQTAGIRETLRVGGYQAEPIIEYMDWKRAPSKENLEALYRLYRLKYAKRPLAVVFVTDNAALDFALLHREEIFRGAKVVFCGINGYTDRMLAGSKDVTGVVEEVDPAGTLDVALKLHPEAKEVLIVFDGTESGQAARNSVARQVRKYGTRIKFRFLDDALVSEIQEEVRKMPPGNLVLQGAYSRDRNGKTYNLDEVLKIIAPDSPVPIYGLWETMCGKGIVGGSLLSGRTQGEAAARMGLRILAGESVASIPVLLKPPMVLMFDYRQLRRFKIDSELLPGNSIVINRPVSFYAAYKHIFWFFMAVIGILSVTIGVLTVTIAARRRADRALKSEKQYTEQIISIAPTMICSFALDGRILSSNNAVDNYFESASGALQEKNWWEIFCNYSAQQIEQLLEALRQGPVLGQEMALGTGSAKRRIISWNLVARFSQGAPGMEIIGVGADITERKRAEEERERFLRELESMNKELESIVYVASHDLRSPLVNIQGFSRKLGKACGEIGTLLESVQIPEEPRLALGALQGTIGKSLHFITSSVEKMDALLGGLLRLSRLGRKALKNESIDMDRLLCDVVTSMTYQVQKSGGAVEVEPLLPCSGDAVQINQVFSNLIDNAIKYAAPERPPLVRISSRRADDRVIFSVTDNGIGIPLAQQEKIWEVFHRLNPDGSAEGEGLGLTMVRRILDRSNGQVWVESAAGAGSVFFVALPCADDQSPERS